MKGGKQNPITYEVWMDDGTFGINNNGLIFVNSSVDREMKSLYNFRVRLINITFKNFVQFHLVLRAILFPCQERDQVLRSNSVMIVILQLIIFSCFFPSYPFDCCSLLFEILLYFATYLFT